MPKNQSATVSDFKQKFLKEKANKADSTASALRKKAAMQSIQTTKNP